ncbi:MAG: hypothetical protein HZC37_12535 [Burkholderiales bacterium]|nr:hypothetical protein [Burkholderiales bacterium]
MSSHDQGRERVRLRVLCPTLRGHVGGLSDIEAPRHEIAALSWQPTRVLRVENLEAALALPEMPGTVALMNVGDVAGLLAASPWLRQSMAGVADKVDTSRLALADKAATADQAGGSGAPQQLDIFADSGDVMRRNACADAVLADDAVAARAALAAWRAEWPDDALLEPAARLCAFLHADGRAQPAPALSTSEVQRAGQVLDGEIGPAAATVLGPEATAWLHDRWRRLAEQARAVPWHPEHAPAHAAALFLRAAQWQAAAQAVQSIESWRRIPQPLLWMAEARWHIDGADAAWPLLAEAFWLAPERAHALLESLADTRLRRLLTRFEDDFAPDRERDWAWWPAWLAVDQPLLAEVLDRAEKMPDRDAAAGCHLVIALLRLERGGLHHDLVAARKELRALEPRLFECYMRTR